MTEPTDNNSTETASSDETIRKIWARDLKAGAEVHTVFRAAVKEKIAARSGKTFLKLTLADRTGLVDGRIFDNVGAADSAFSTDDYLLVKGRVDEFKGRLQIVIARLERLDPGPINADDFAFAAPPPEEKREERRDEKHEAKVRLSRRLERLLEVPQVAQALDAFVAQLEKALVPRDAPAGAPKHERPERKPKGPRVEHRPKPEEPKRDPSLPEGLAFKPLAALVGEGAKSEDSNS